MRATTVCAICAVTVGVWCGCGGAKQSEPQTVAASKPAEPGPAEEYAYFMEQAGLAMAEQRLDDAVDYYDAAAEAAQKIGTDEAALQQADALNAAADLLYQLYRREEAISHYEAAIEIYRKYAGNSQTKAAVAYTNMGVIYKELHDKAKARTCWQQALAIYEALPPEQQDSGNMEKIRQNIRDLDAGF